MKTDTCPDIIGVETPARHSAHIGVLVKVGSRHEHHAERGMAHFVEHMFFNGTATRDKKRLHADIDLAGETNAYTDRDHTYYYIDTSADGFEAAAEILADIILNSTFPEDEIAKEKKVVLSEINRIEDTPNNVIWNHAFLNSCGHGLGSPIAGYKKTVSKFSRGMVGLFVETYYTAESMIVVGAAALPAKKIRHILRAKFTGGNCSTSPAADLTPKLRPKETKHHRAMNDVHMVITYPGPAYADKDRPAAIILNQILGVGFSSRLNRKIREELGCAYAVGSAIHSFRDIGLFHVYAATFPKDFERVAEHAVVEVAALLDTMTAAEIEDAKVRYIRERKTNHDKPRIVAQYHAFRRMYNADMPFDTYMKSFERVTLRDVRAAADKYFGNQYNFTALGPFNKE